MKLKEAIEEAKKENRCVTREGWPQGRGVTWTFLESILKGWQPLEITLDENCKSDDKWEVEKQVGN